MYPTKTTFYSKKEIRTMQENKLHDLLVYVNGHSPYYRKLFAALKIRVDEIKTLEMFSVIPTTSKEDLQKYNWDFLCVDRNEITEYTTTSGTLGNPVTVVLNDNDLDRLAYNEFTSFVCADGSSSDVYQLMISLDRQFMAGLAYYTGLRKLGAGIIRLGPATSGFQWESILRLKPTAIVAVPSQLMKLIGYAQENNSDINATSVRKAICIGESIRNADLSLNTLGRKINASWNIKLYSTYASTEMQTAFTECKEGNGCHHQPEFLIVEILDENNMQVAPGEMGEVTITTLGVEAMPLLRYRTGDLCYYMDDPCACGRNSLRLSPVLSRKKQLIKFKGTTIYPPALIDILNETEEVGDFIIEVFSNELNIDEVLIHIVPIGNPNACDERIKSNLQARLRVIPSVIYVTSDEIISMQKNVSGRKAVKFLDRRK